MKEKRELEKVIKKIAAQIKAIRATKLLKIPPAKKE